MDDYNSKNAPRQEAKKGVGVSPAVPGEVGLHDTKFPWRQKRWRNAGMASAAESAGLKERAIRYAGCGIALGYGIDEQGRHLTAANLCHQRLCPICSARLAKRRALQLASVLTEGQARIKGIRYLFVTLTARNCADFELRDAVTDILQGWRNMVTSPRSWGLLKSGRILGAYRALEITRNASESGGELEFHPHLHSILAVNPSYFRDSEQYITHDALMELWRRALAVDYQPTVRISALYAGRRGEGSGKRSGADTRAAIAEAAKYSAKDADILSGSSAAERGRVYKAMSEAMERRRLAEYNGLLRTIAHDIGADGKDETQDLVHLSDDAETDTAYQILEHWAWHDGADDYVCTDVIYQ